ncbi:MAG: leucyl aminopeptidase family protein [bacterium]|nr:leucyl aminopeptidase family protein [bacterium]
MQVRVSNQNLKNIEADALYLAVFEDKSLSEKMVQLDKQLNSALSDFLKLKEFKGKLYETAVLYPQGLNFQRLILVGMGKEEDFEAPRMTKNVAGAAAKRAIKLGVKKLATLLNHPEETAGVVEGVGLASFDAGMHKTKKEKLEIQELILVGADEKVVGEAQAAAETINWVRHLIAEPANLMTPARVVEEAKKIAKTYKLGIEIIDEKEAKKRKMGAFLAIAQGSDESSYMIVLHYKAPKPGKTVLGIVGKGITFDSGGISIKPSAKMADMKMDMSGAAAMLGIMKLVGEFKPNLDIIGIAPVTENMPSGKAAKPGDVFKSLSGRTIEILNTDAEGRVVMSDAFTYVQKLGAKKIFELSTLTGAVNVALGPEATAIIGSSQEWVDTVISAGKRAGERIWQLPIYSEHKEMLKSDIADLANIPPTRAADVIAGGVFLGEFVEKENDWAHLDIGATAWLEGDKPYLTKGPTGVGIETALALIKALEGN